MKILNSYHSIKDSKGRRLFAYSSLQCEESSRSPTTLRFLLSVEGQITTNGGVSSYADVQLLQSVGFKQGQSIDDEKVPSTIILRFVPDPEKDKNYLFQSRNNPRLQGHGDHQSANEISTRICSVYLYLESFYRQPWQIFPFSTSLDEDDCTVGSSRQATTARREHASRRQQEHCF